MEYHEAANIFPLDEEHIDDLADDIRKNGLLVPLETYEGKLLDGRRRWLACKKANVKPRTMEAECTDPVAYVLSLNLHRRHLSPTQLGMVGARARAIYDEQAKARQKQGKEKLPYPSESGQARDAAGKAVGVSGKTIDAATRVLKQGTPSLVAAVDADKLAVSTAARAAAMTEAEQNALASRAMKGAKRQRHAENGHAEPDDKPGEKKGMGIIRANEAINCLTRIPKNDALRKRGFQLVTDWIRRNK